MKKYRLLIVIILLFAGAGLFLVLKPGSGSIKHALIDFAVTDTANIVKIFLADKANQTILLERQTDNSWTVNGEYNARKDLTDLLLGTMISLQARAPVPKASYNTVIKNMASRSVKVEVYQQLHRINLFNRIRAFPYIKKSRVYYVGDITPDNIGTFMIMENSTMPFVVYWPGFRGFIASRYSVSLNDWRDHSIFNYRITQVQSIEMIFNQQPAQSYKVSNIHQGKAVIEPVNKGSSIQSYDTLKMLSFLTAFENIRFEALLNDMDEQFIDSIATSPPLHIIRVTDVYGKVNEVRTFSRSAFIYVEDTEGNPFEHDTERMYALINDERDFVLIQYFVFDKILRPLDYFRGGIPNSS